MKRSVFLLLALVCAPVFAAEELECEKLSGTHDVAFYGQSFVARYTKYKVSLTFEDSRGLKYVNNWGENREVEFDKDHVVTWATTSWPGSMEGIRSIAAAADPESYLSTVGSILFRLKVAERNIDKSQGDLAGKQKVLACSKKRLSDLALEVRKKFLQTRQLEVKEVQN